MGKKRGLAQMALCASSRCVGVEGRERGPHFQRTKIISPTAEIIIIKKQQQHRHQSPTNPSLTEEPSSAGRYDPRLEPRPCGGGGGHVGLSGRHQWANLCLSACVIA